MTQYLVVFTSSDDYTYMVADQVEAGGRISAIGKWLTDNTEIDGVSHIRDWLNKEVNDSVLTYSELQWEMQLRFNIQMHVVPMSTVLGE